MSSAASNSSLGPAPCADVPSSAPEADDAQHLAELLRCTLGGARRLVAVTGAGMSTAAGIPDFRSPTDGLYALIRRLPALSARLSEPQELFDVDIFRSEPELLFGSGVAATMLSSLGAAAPTRSHCLLAGLETAGVLLRQYTQNIDCLEAAAGVTRLVQAHGTLATASCLVCKRTVPAEEISADVRAKVVPRCRATAKCRKSASAVLKPDVVFFREALPPSFWEAAEADLGAADALLIVGSSMKVKPVADFPRRVGSGVPVVVVNRDPLVHLAAGRGGGGGEAGPVITLLGDCDAVMTFLVQSVWPAAAATVTAAAGNGEAAAARAPPSFRVRRSGPSLTWSVEALDADTGAPYVFKQVGAGSSGSATSVLDFLGGSEGGEGGAASEPVVTRSGRVSKRARLAE